jgi:hypothetical protein
VADIALCFVIPVALLVLAATAGLGGLVSLKANDSPFVKILADASALFRKDARLWLIPLALLFFFLALSASFLLIWPLMFAQLLLWSGSPATRAETLLIGTLWTCLFASTVGGAVVVTVADAVLAEAFVEESRGEPSGFFRSAWAVARRLPALLAFGVLWGATLAVGSLIRWAVQDAAERAGGWFLAVPVLVAGWALELGFTMASYFMLLMIVREGLGPLQALGRAVELARADFGGNLAEVFAIKALDTGIMIASMGLFVLTFVGSVFGLVGDVAQSSDPYLLWKAAGLSIASAVVVPVAYFVALQTLQIIVAAASYLYVRDGVMVPGFVASDFDRVVGLRPRSLRAVGLLR